jgi:hypothetical protein
MTVGVDGPGGLGGSGGVWSKNKSANTSAGSPNDEKGFSNGDPAAMGFVVGCALLGVTGLFVMSRLAREGGAWEPDGAMKPIVAWVLWGRTGTS